MDEIIKADLYRYEKLHGIKGFIKGLMVPGFRYTYFFRQASKYRKTTLIGLLFRLLLKKYSYKYGFQISPETNIGGGLFIGHFGTIVINRYAVIGRNCNIAHGVTVGKANRGKLKGYPTIGDNVWIGTNTVIVGKIKIGSNVLISPCSFINFDIPDNSLVIGNSIKHRDNSTEGYIRNIKESNE